MSSAPVSLVLSTPQGGMPSLVKASAAKICFASSALLCPSSSSVPPERMVQLCTKAVCLLYVLQVLCQFSSSRELVTGLDALHKGLNGGARSGAMNSLHLCDILEDVESKKSEGLVQLCQCGFVHGFHQRKWPFVQQSLYPCNVCFLSAFFHSACTLLFQKWHFMKFSFQL